MKRSISNKRQSLFRLAALVGVLILLNVIAGSFYKRFDLTAEKRFSVSEATAQLLRGVDDVVYVKVYLEGDFPAGFKRLRDATKDMLREFERYSGNKLEFVFIDPSLGSEEQRNLLYQDLVSKGLEPTNLKVRDTDGSSEKIIFPGLVMNYRNKELAIHLLENQVGQGPQEVLNNSVELLEYKLASAVKKITQKRKPRIAFSEGQGELPDYALSDINQTLTKLQYEIERVDLKSELTLQGYDILIIPKPTQAFREQEKFKIDQFIMNGGSVLWLLDQMNAEMDSMRTQPVFMASGRDVNLQDQLFKYGVRINDDLIQDIQCNPIPLVVGAVGGSPQTELFPWYYYPIITSRNEHAITKNLDGIALQFASTIDTVKAPGVRKTFLLHTSDYSKALFSPVRLHFSMLKEKVTPENFQKSALPLAVILEGSFESVFKNRLAFSTMQMIDSLNEVSFKDSTAYAKMIVVADGDIIKNEVSNSGNIYPLGYYSVTRQSFANKDFILNCIEYLTDNTALIETRNKEVSLRLLDKLRIQENKGGWQLLNTAVPVLLVIVFGLIYNFIRRRKYAR